jgi:hypothetical protein
MALSIKAGWESFKCGDLLISVNEPVGYPEQSVRDPISE